MLIERLNPPQFSGLHVRLQNDLISCGKMFPVREEDATLRIRFVCCRAGWVSESCLRLILSIDNRRAEIWIEPELGSGIAERLREFDGGKSLPKPFQQALEGMIARGIIDAVETLIQLPVSLDLEGVNQDQGANEEIGAALEELCFEILSEQSNREGRGKILLSADIVERLLESADREPARMRPNLSELPLRGQLIFGTVKLSGEEYRTLEAGAILLLDEPCALASGEAVFMLEDGGNIPVNIEPDSLHPLLTSLLEPRLREILPQEDSGYADQNDPRHDGPSSGMEIVVSFGAGSGTLTLDEILNLTKSGIPEEKVKIYPPVQIIANGVTIGSGELLEIKGRRGLLITSSLSQV